jgi:hypothetical protein
MSSLLILKLFLVPAFIAGITLAGRRWGPAVAGALAGCPVLAGPILLFLTIEQGAHFAAHAATASILGVLGNTGFCITYSWMCRHKAWHVSLFAGWAVFGCVAALLNQVQVTPLQASIVTICGLLIAARSYPRVSIHMRKDGYPRSDLIYRMLAAAALVLALTYFSSRLGSSLTGLFTVFPVMGSVLGVFSHRNYGAGFAVKILQGIVQGFYALTVFCLILACTLEYVAWPVCFLMATVSAILLQAILMHRQARIARRTA